MVDAQGAEPDNGYEEDCGEEEVDAFGVEKDVGLFLLYVGNI